MAGDPQSCPYQVGELVRFSPSPRTLGLYQDIDAFGVAVGQVLPIAEIREDCYLYFANGAGGWPWNEFTPADGHTQSGGPATA